MHWMHIFSILWLIPQILTSSSFILFISNYLQILVFSTTKKLLSNFFVVLSISKCNILLFSGNTFHYDRECCLNSTVSSVFVKTLWSIFKFELLRINYHFQKQLLNPKLYDLFLSALCLFHCFFKLKERVLNLNRGVCHGLTEFAQFHKLSRCVSSLHLKTAGWQVSKPVNWFIMSISLWVSHLHVSVHHCWCSGFICKFKCNLHPNSLQFPFISTCLIGSDYKEKNKNIKYFLKNKLSEKDYLLILWGTLVKVVTVWVMSGFRKWSIARLQSTV